MDRWRCVFTGRHQWFQPGLRAAVVPAASLQRHAHTPHHALVAQDLCPAGGENDVGHGAHANGFPRADSREPACRSHALRWPHARTASLGAECSFPQTAGGAGGAAGRVRQPLVRSDAIRVRLAFDYGNEHGNGTEPGMRGAGVGSRWRHYFALVLHARIHFGCAARRDPAVARGLSCSLSLASMESDAWRVDWTPGEFAGLCSLSGTAVT